MSIKRKYSRFIGGFKFAFCWTALMAIVFLSAVASVRVCAQTAPCAQAKPCVIERNDNKQRNTLEANGVASDLAESLLDRAGDHRYWLRCWQKGVLITERVTRSPPSEYRAAVSLTSSDDKAIKMFDLKNAVCTVEPLGRD